MSSAPAAESMLCTCDSFRDRTWRALPFLGIVGFSTHKRSLLLPCHSALRQGRGSSSACKSMSLAHKLLFGVVLNVACQHHRANRSVRVPARASDPFASPASAVLPVTGGSHPGSTQRLHSRELSGSSDRDTDPSSRSGAVQRIPESSRPRSV